MEKLAILEQGEGYVAYDCDTCIYIKLEKDAVVADHQHSHKETVFLLEGEVEVTIVNETTIISAPSKLIIPGNTYHKFKALTEVTGLEMK